MLAAVSIVPVAGMSSVSMLAYEGDMQMIAALRGRVAGNELILEGEIPFKESSSRRSFRSRGSYTRITGGVRSFSGDIVIGAIVGDNNISIGSGMESINIDGREVDLDRAIRVVVIVPSTMNFKVTDALGEIGIADSLDATLDYSSTIKTKLVASHVRFLSGSCAGSSSARIARVSHGISMSTGGSSSIAISDGTTPALSLRTGGSSTFKHLGEILGDATLVSEGSSEIDLGEVRGVVNADTSGSSELTIFEGVSTQLTVKASGNSEVKHEGVINGDVIIGMSGSSEATLREVRGHLSVDASNSSEILVKRGSSLSTRATVSGNSEVKHGGAVTGDAIITAEGNSEVEFGEVRGALQVDASGSGEILIMGGTSSTMRGTATGMSEITHKGVITHEAILTASGQAEIKVKMTDPSKAEKKKSGMAEIKVKKAA